MGHERARQARLRATFSLLTTPAATHNFPASSSRSKLCEGVTTSRDFIGRSRRSSVHGRVAETSRHSLKEPSLEAVELSIPIRELFFVSSNDLAYQFNYVDDPHKFVIDMSHSHIWDASTVAALDAITTKYHAKANTSKSLA